MYLEALGETWGMEAYRSPDSIGGVVDRVRAWLDDRCHSRELLSATMAALSPLENFQEETVPDNLDPELRKLREALLEGLNGTLECLEALRDAVQEEEKEAVKEALLELEEAAAETRDAQAALDSWVRAPIARCPKCGCSGSERCPTCKTECLVPDPDFEELELPESLGPSQLRVLESYLAVLRGDGTLEQLEPALQELEDTLAQLLSLAQRAEDELPGAKRVPALVERSGEGIASMRRARASRRMGDLNHGWKLILEGALEMQRIIATLS